jgi:hypothetical protein
LEFHVDFGVPQSTIKRTSLSSRQQALTDSLAGIRHFAKGSNAVAKRVSLKDLAARCRVSRPAVLQKLKKLKIRMEKEPRLTARGVQMSTTVSKKDADRVAAPYEQARRAASIR